MIKNIINYIFIYILSVGCHTLIPTQSHESESQVYTCESEYHVNIEAPDLVMDENGYCHIEWLDGYIQTFTTLSLQIQDNLSSSFEYVSFIFKVYWDSDSGIEYMGEWVSCVNHASYSNNLGIAHTVLAVWEEQIGDTILVYSSFEDECGIEYNNILRVVVDE